MTKVKKLLKKAFTLVELVVVVAIIAILSGVSVAAYVGITDRANKASDQETVAQLNHQLAAEEAINGKNGTCFDAIKDCFSTGLNLEELRPSTKNSQFVWDQDNDRFAIINEDLEVVAEDSTLKLTSNQNHRWVLSSTYTLNAKKNPIYLLDGCSLTDLAVTTGIDTGINTNIKSIAFTAPAEAPQGDIVIRTNLVDTTLTVDASDAKLANTNIQHYGIAGIVSGVKTTNTNKYVENGTVINMELVTGNAEFTRDSKIFRMSHNEGENAKPVIETSLIAEIYDKDGILDRNFASNFNADTTEYTTTALNKIICAHTDCETLVDAKAAYKICYACGCSLINLNESIDFTVDSVTKAHNCIFGVAPILFEGTTAIVASTSILDRTSIFKPLGLYSEPANANWKIENGYISTPSIASSNDLVPVIPQMEINQRFCSHTNIKYVENTVNSQWLHNVICEDCGYTFSDIHSNDEECELCHIKSHQWDDTNHVCTHPGHDCIKYSYSDANGSVTIAICGFSIRVWGFTSLTDILHSKASVSAAVTPFKLQTLIETGMSSTYLSKASNITLKLVDSAYVPGSFCSGTRCVRQVILPETIKHLDSGCFGTMVSLTSITLPDSLETIGNQAFLACSLRSIKIPAHCLVKFQVFNTNLLLETAEFAEGVTQICNQAFLSCTRLKRVQLPSTITRIGNLTFNKCNGLTDIYYAGTIAQWKQIILTKYSAGNEVDNSTTELTWIQSSVNVVHCSDGDITKPA